MGVATISSILLEKVDNIVDLNIKEMIDDALQLSWLFMSEKEKRNFYDRYI